MSLETLAAALAFALLRLIYDRTERGRFLARRLYSTAAYPFVLRMGPVTAPLLAAAFAVVAVALALSGPARLLVATAGITTAFWAGAASYLAQPPLMARWMREEIRLGKLARATPDRDDRVVFWVFVAFAVAMPLLGVAMVLMGQAR